MPSIIRQPIDHQIITEGNGTRYRYVGPLNKWINIGSLLEGELVNYSRNGFITPEISAILQSIPNNPQDFKIKGLTDAYYYLIKGSNRLFLTSIENDDLRIEINKNALQHLLYRTACQGPKGIIGNIGDDGRDGFKGPSEQEYIATINNKKLTLQLEIPTPLDTEISIRLYNKKEHNIEIWYDIHNKEWKIIESTLDIDEDSTIEIVDGILNISIISDEWPGQWYIKARQRGPAGKNGLDGSNFIEINGSFVNTIKAANVLINLRKAPSDNNLFIIRRPVIDATMPVSRLRPFSSQTSGDICGTAFGLDFAATSENTKLLAAEPSIDSNKRLRRWAFSPNPISIDDINLPEWTPDPACGQNIRYDWFSRFNNTDQQLGFGIRQAPIIPKRCCQEDFYFCPNLGNPCRITSGGPWIPFPPTPIDPDPDPDPDPESSSSDPDPDPESSSSSSSKAGCEPCLNYTDYTCLTITNDIVSTLGSEPIVWKAGTYELQWSDNLVTGDCEATLSNEELQRLYDTNDYSTPVRSTTIRYSAADGQWQIELGQRIFTSEFEDIIIWYGINNNCSPCTGNFIRTGGVHAGATTIRIDCDCTVSSSSSSATAESSSSSSAIAESSSSSSADAGCDCTEYNNSELMIVFPEFYTGIFKENAESSRQFDIHIAPREVRIIKAPTADCYFPVSDSGLVTTSIPDPNGLFPFAGNYWTTLLEWRNDKWVITIYGIVAESDYKELVYLEYERKDCNPVGSYTYIEDSIIRRAEDGNSDPIVSEDRLTVSFENLEVIEVPLGLDAGGEEYCLELEDDIVVNGTTLRSKNTAYTLNKINENTWTGDGITLNRNSPSSWWILISGVITAWTYIRSLNSPIGDFYISSGDISSIGGVPLDIQRPIKITIRECTVSSSSSSATAGCDCDTTFTDRLGFWFSPTKHIRWQYPYTTHTQFITANPDSSWNMGYQAGEGGWAGYAFNEDNVCNDGGLPIVKLVPNLNYLLFDEERCRWYLGWTIWKDAGLTEIAQRYRWYKSDGEPCNPEGAYTLDADYTVDADAVYNQHSAADFPTVVDIVPLVQGCPGDAEGWKLPGP